MLLRFIKKYAEILAIGGFLAYWFWDAKLSVLAIPFFKDLKAIDWINLFNAVVALFLSLLGIWGITSWRHQHKKTRQDEAVINFAEQCFNSIDSIGFITSNTGNFSEFPDDFEVAEDKFHYMVTHRLSSEQHIFNTLFANRHRYKIILGNEAYKLTEDISDLLYDIRLMADKHLLLQNELNSDPIELAGNIGTLNPKDDETIEDLLSQLKEVTKKLTYYSGSPMYNKLNKLRERTEAIIHNYTIK